MVTQTFAGESRVESVIEAGLLRVRRTAAVELDRRKGFSSVVIAGVEFRRSDPGAAQRSLPTDERRK